MVKFIVILIIALAILAFDGVEWASGCLGDLLKFLFIIDGGIAVTVVAFLINGGIS